MAEEYKSPEPSGVSPERKRKHDRIELINYYTSLSDDEFLEGIMYNAGIHKTLDDAGYDSAKLLNEVLKKRDVPKPAPLTRTEKLITRGAKRVLSPIGKFFEYTTERPKRAVLGAIHGAQPPGEPTTIKEAVTATAKRTPEERKKVGAETRERIAEGFKKGWRLEGPTTKQVVAEQKKKYPEELTKAERLGIFGFDVAADPLLAFPVGEPIAAVAKKGVQATEKAIGKTVSRGAIKSGEKRVAEEVAKVGIPGEKAGSIETKAREFIKETVPLKEKFPERYAAVGQQELPEAVLKVAKPEKHAKLVTMRDAGNISEKKFNDLVKREAFRKKGGGLAEIHNTQTLIEQPWKTVETRIKKKFQKVGRDIEKAKGELPGVATPQKPGRTRVPLSVQYSEIAPNVERLSSELAAGKISRLNFNAKLNKLLKSVNFPDDIRKEIVGVSMKEFPSDVWVRLAINEPDKYKMIQEMAAQFEKGGSTRMLEEAQQLFINSKAAQSWKKMLESGEERVTAATLKSIRKNKAVNRKAAAMAREFFGATKVDDLVETEARWIEYLSGATKFKPGGRQLYFPEVERIADGYFWQSVNARDPVAFFDSFNKYMGIPREVFERFGLTQYHDALKSGFVKMKGKERELFTEFQQLKKTADSIDPENASKIFWALETGDDAALGQLKPIADRIRQVYDEMADLQGMPKNIRKQNYVTHTAIGLSKQDALNILIENNLIKSADELSDEAIYNIMKRIGDNKVTVPPEIAALLPYMRRNVRGEIPQRFLQKRMDSPVFNPDVWVALQAYTRPALRYAYMRKPYKMLSDIRDKVPGSAAADYLEAFQKNMMGTPIIGKRYTTAAKIEEKAADRVFIGALGLAPDSTLKNFTQGINTVSEIGGDYALKGYFYLTKNRRAAYKELLDLGIVDSGRLAELAKTQGYRAITKSKLDKWDDFMMLPFGAAEIINRGSAYFGARSKFLAENAGKFTDDVLTKKADDFARDVVRKTQFEYTPLDVPLALQSPAGRVGGQFLTYPTGQANLVYNWIKNGEIEKFDRYLRMNYGLWKMGEATGYDLENFTGTGAVPTQIAPIPSMLKNSAAMILNGIDEGKVNPNDWVEDSGRRATENMKRLSPLLIKGGRYAKKVIDYEITESRGGKRYKGAEVYGRIHSPLMEPPTGQFVIETPARRKGRLKGITPSYVTRDYEEKQEVRRAEKRFDEKRRNVYADVFHYLRFKKTGELKKAKLHLDRARKAADGIGLDLKGTSDKQIDKKIARLLKNNRDALVKDVLGMFGSGNEAEEREGLLRIGLTNIEYGNMRLNLEKFNAQPQPEDVRSYLKSLYKISDTDRTAMNKIIGIREWVVKTYGQKNWDAIDFTDEEIQKIRQGDVDVK